MRVAVAMSGGVDSLRAVTLLKESGHEVFGVHMRLLPASREGRWCAESVLQESEGALKSLCVRLGIPLSIVDMRDAFERAVITPFLQAYRRGLTPNPCVLCNPRIKFGLLRKEAFRLGAERLATGHYARVLPPETGHHRFRLARGADPAKDQSYFLYGLTQEQLGEVWLPLGASRKRDIQRWAGETGYSHLVSGESQEICFIPQGDYLAFLVERFGLPREGIPGPIVDMEGRVLGEHRGIHAYTVGQRRGLGIPSTAPYYVVKLDPRANSVHVGRNDDLLQREVRVHAVNWVSVPPPSEPLCAAVRIRNQHLPAPARLIPIDSQEVLIHFHEPQRAVTPGQAAVFYDGDLVLGGGTILANGVSR